MTEKLKNMYALMGYNFPLLIAFLLPFGINYAIFIIIWFVAFLAFDQTKMALKGAFNNKWLYPFLLFFLLHSVTYFFSANKHDALNAIEIKLSFLAFPILIFASNYDEVKLKKIMISFVSGSFLVAVFYLFRALFLYFFENTNAFFYTDFTYFMHPSYFAMYLVFAQLIVMLFYKDWLGHLANLNFKIGFISVVFLVCIFLCSSKMGLITAGLFIPATAFSILYKQGYKKTLLLVFSVFVLGVVAAYNLFPKPFERIKMALTVSSNANAIDKTVTESTAVRILIWQESLNLVREKPMFGVTPGDVNDVLDKAYEQHGLTGALQKHLNTHNQYIQTLLGTGIVGFLILLLFSIGPLVLGIVKRNLLLVLFCGIVLLNYLVESMLQAQAGFIFIVFFSCLLLKYNLSKLTLNAD